MAREFFINPKGPFDPYITQLFSRACAFSTHSGTGLVTLETYFTEKSEQPLHPTNKRQSLVFTPSTSPEFPPSYLISIGYDGSLRKCFLRLYDPASHKIHFWYDDTGHKPYCLSKQTMSEIQKNTNVVKNPGFDHLEEDSKYDALREMPLTVTKIVAKDPLTIGGKPTGSIRDAITAWEADIKYVENYIYDSGIEPGMMYEVKNNQLSLLEYRLPEQASKDIEELFRDDSPEYRELAREWMRLLECPVPEYRRAAIDIEVMQAVE